MHSFAHLIMRSCLRYNAESSLSELTYGDGSTKLGSYTYEYDSLGRLIRSSEYDGSGNAVQRTEQKYDAYSRLQSQAWRVGNTDYSESYAYSDGANGDGSLTRMTTATGDELRYDYDPLKRLTSRAVYTKSGTGLFENRYAFKAGAASNQTTAQIEYYSVRNGVDGTGSAIITYKYVYDALGNITEIRNGASPNALLVSYQYDDQNQLVKETYANGDEYDYIYDTAGNILTESKNGTVTKTYTYGNSQWNDLLTRFAGYDISYDGAGNPLAFVNGKRMYSYMTWERGRQLVSLAADDGDEIYDISYAYSADGIRTRKTVSSQGHGTESHAYITQNGKVVRETVGSGTAAKVLDFLYDESGSPFALKYSTNGGSSFTTYYYVVNLQGDVVKLIDENGETAAEYTYNAWGEILSVTDADGNAITDRQHIAHVNPLRYRGYYYDSETGFYYLQSRYYDPVTHRFINADSFATTGQGFTGTNMFACCNNNPVSYTDPSGNMAEGFCTKVINDGGGVPSGANIANIMRLFGVSTPQELPKLKRGEMVYVENIESVSYGFITILRGHAIVMDKNKYCEYYFAGTGAGLSGFITDYVINVGYVYPVVNVQDYEGLFISSSLNCVLDGDGYAVAPNGVRAKVIKTQGYLGFSAGISGSGYTAMSNTWIYGEAPLNWVPSYNLYPWGCADGECPV